MFKTVLTLFRGRSADAAEAFTDANALPLLRQQIRDAGAAVKKSRQAVAIAMAGQEQEVARHAKIKKQIADLETRAMAAIEANKAELAQEAAEAIAGLEDEKASSEKAQARFNAEISRLKKEIRTAQLKMRDLERGQRLAVATQHTQKLADESPLDTNSTLREAEETLARLEQRQQATDLTRKAEAELETSTAPADVAERMAEAGLGAPLRSSADDVLARLKAKAEKPTKKAS
ncbi:PspA/IM30 family protein [Pseudahrensia aquimaris]|uniref:PspA/IM30 family protein n=1 Tax=Pseudahrensia aquimaris TaxID=744461 RepID=A0ABW3FHR9_9HYPH